MKRISRCKPLLGTFVEIDATFEVDSSAESVVQSAYVLITELANLLNYYDEQSWLSQLNRQRSLSFPSSSNELFTLFSDAARITKESGGSFNPFINRDDGIRAAISDPAEDLISVEGAGVVLLKDSVDIELGGIAKGFIVDAAKELLVKLGAIAGSVNAGGDMYVFGEKGSEVSIRSAEGSVSQQTIQLKNSAIATSADYASVRFSQPGKFSRLNTLNGKRSISIVGSSCTICDALTKVVASLGDAAIPLLRQYNCQAHFN